MIEQEAVVEDEIRRVLRGQFTRRLEILLCGLWRSEGDVESSLATDGLHYPVLDIDFPCTLKESETKGHFHLKIDKGIPWDKYERMLAARADAGVSEQGYYNASVEREATFIAVRPWKQRLRRSKEVNPTKKIGSIGSAAKTGLFFPRNFDDF